MNNLNNPEDRTKPSNCVSFHDDICFEEQNHNENEEHRKHDLTFSSKHSTSMTAHSTPPRVLIGCFARQVGGAVIQGTETSNVDWAFGASILIHVLDQIIVFKTGLN